MTKQRIAVEQITACNSCGSPSTEVVATSRDFQFDTCSNEFSFVRCQQCGLIYLRDRPAISTLGVIYPPNYGPYKFDERLGPVINRVRNYVQRRKIEPIVEQASPNAIVVDVGCGGGGLLRIMKRLGPSGWRLIGVDISATASQQLASVGIEFRIGRFESMEWDLPNPDVIIMNQVIEHLDDPSMVVRRSFELLKPGGILLIETPSVDAWDARLFYKRYWGGWHTPRHWTLYTPATLAQLVQRHGFALITIKHILSPTFWLQSVHHWMLEKRPLSRFARFSDITHLVPLGIATMLDWVQLICTRKTSNFRLIARKPVQPATG
jgi:2-polyprenyl-3-methyl-5-hydroxy-6-metoxy-1,4-benzoquinol methylase